jgi:hypothetical protein
MLPNLPKKIKHKESDFGTKIFKPWVHNNVHLFHSCTFELKDSKGKDSIPFNSVEDLQIDACLSIKWSDKGYLIRNLTGTVGAPDYSFYKNAPAYVVMNYGKLGFVIIDIETFIEEKKRSQRKSLTFTRACAIAYKTVIHKKTMQNKKEDL